MQRCGGNLISSVVGHAHHITSQGVMYASSLSAETLNHSSLDWSSEEQVIVLPTDMTPLTLSVDVNVKMIGERCILGKNTGFLSKHFRVQVDRCSNLSCAPSVMFAGMPIAFAAILFIHAGVSRSPAWQKNVYFCDQKVIYKQPR